MKLLLAFALFCFAAHASAVSPKQEPQDLLALHAIVPNDDFNQQIANHFEFERALTNPASPEIVRGFYRENPILTLHDIAEIRIATKEIATIPVSGLRIRITKEGARNLAEFLRQTGNMGLIAIVDGHPYATIPTPLVREMIDDRTLFIVLPGPQSPTYDHFLHLLVDKLSSHLHPKQ